MTSTICGSARTWWCSAHARPRLGGEIKGEGLIGLTRGFCMPARRAWWRPVGDRRPHHRGADEAVLRGDAGSRREAGGRVEGRAGRHVENQGLGCTVLLGGVYASGRMAVNPVEDAARQRWSLTQEAFDGLLASLGPDRDTAADRYLEIRRNLVRLFDWRGCSTPDEYADETINRCAKKIGEGEEIRDLATYCCRCCAHGPARDESRTRARSSALWTKRRSRARCHPNPKTIRNTA